MKQCQDFLFHKMTTGAYIPDVEELERIAWSTNKNVMFFFMKESVDDNVRKKNLISDLVQWGQQHSVAKVEALIEFLKMNGS